MRYVAAMVSGLTAPVLAAAVLLALAAPGKLRRPLPTVNAMRAAGLPSSRPAVRALGAAELMLAAVVLVAPSRPALAALSCAYLGFAAFVAVLLRRGAPLSSCGCFGKDDTPATRTHVVVVGLLALVVVAAAFTGGVTSVQHVVAATPWAGVPVLATVAAVTGLLWASLAVLPGTLAAQLPPPAPARLREAR